MKFRMCAAAALAGAAAMTAGPVPASAEPELRLKLAWHGEGPPKSSLLILTAENAPADPEAARALWKVCEDRLLGKYAKLTCTVGGRTYHSYQPIQDTSQGLAGITYFEGGLPALPPGAYTEEVVVTLLGQPLRATASFTIEEGKDIPARRRRLEEARAALAEQLVKMEKEKGEVLGEMEDLRKERAEQAQRASDASRSAADREEAAKGVAECDRKIAKGEEMLAQMDGREGGKGWVRDSKDERAERHHEVGTSHYRLGQYTEARAAWEEALRWRDPEQRKQEYEAFALLALEDADPKAYREWTEKAGRKPDLEKMARLAILYHDDRASAWSYLQEWAQREGIDPTMIEKAGVPLVGMPPPNAEIVH